MSEILGHQPGELEIYPEVEVPETEIHKISDMRAINEEAVEYFGKEGYVPDEKLCRIMKFVRFEIIKLIKSGKISSYQEVQKAENKFLEEVDNPDKELLIKILFGIAFTNIRAVEKENKKIRSRKEGSKLKEEDVEWGNLIKNFVNEYGSRSKMLKRFWSECSAILNDIPNKAKEFKRKKNPFEIEKTGVLAELAATNFFKEMGLGVEQASIKDDLNNAIDLIVKFKDKFGKSQTVPVQVKYTMPEEKEEILKLCTKFKLVEAYNNFRNSGEDIRKIGPLKKFMIGCINYENQQKRSGKKILLNYGIFMNLRAEGPSVINDRGYIINEEIKKRLKEELQLKLQLELN